MTPLQHLDSTFSLEKSHPDYYYDLLLTIPGFGPYIAALVISTIGNPFRSANSKTLLRIAGLDLSASRSGKSSDSAVAVISKMGSTFI